MRCGQTRQETGGTRGEPKVKPTMPEGAGSEGLGDIDFWNSSLPTRPSSSCVSAPEPLLALSLWALGIRLLREPLDVKNDAMVATCTLDRGLGGGLLP